MDDANKSAEELLALYRKGALGAHLSDCLTVYERTRGSPSRIHWPGDSCLPPHPEPAAPA